MLASIAAHAFAVAAAGVVLPLALRGGGQEVQIEVDLASIDPAIPTDPPPAHAESSPSDKANGPSRARSLAASAPRRTRQPSTSTAPGEAPVAPMEESTPSRFTLPAGSLQTHALVEAQPSRAGSGASASDGARAAGQVELAEKDVSVPARPLSSSEPAYPLAARRADIEADVPVQILIDTEGRVLEARSLTHRGYGLDEAAEQGIRTWVFSPALRDGHPVRVRMRWTVQFRLR